VGAFLFVLLLSNHRLPEGNEQTDGDGHSYIVVIKEGLKT
jgi:6-pyruvoyl-tetrahydropterin synthase